MTPPPPRGALLATGLITVAIAGIAVIQPDLASTVHTVPDEETYVLPPPRSLRAATLGYHAAVADILWAKVLTEYGAHLTDGRPFPNLTRYLDTILALDPSYAPLYRYCDTFLVFHYPRATEHDAKVARRYLERGLRERPSDPEMWLHFGRFVSSIGPSFLTSEPEKARWRQDGSKAVARAVELGADPDAAWSLPHH